MFDKELVKQMMVNYFTTLFTEEGNEEIFAVPQDLFLELLQCDWDFLSLPFTKMDIDVVNKEMGALKAPGPDGFQALFFQKIWELVANNVYELVLRVHEGKGIP